MTLDMNGYETLLGEFVVFHSRFSHHLHYGRIVKKGKDKFWVQRLDSLGVDVVYCSDNVVCYSILKIDKVWIPREIWAKAEKEGVTSKLLGV